MKRVAVLVFGGLVLVLGLLSGVSTSQATDCQYTDPERETLEATVDRMTRAGLLNRYLETPFNAEEYTTLPVTRAEFTALVTRAIGREEEAKQIQVLAPFTDLEGYWYAGYVTLLYQEGIVKGYPGGQFSPVDNISLLHAKVMLARMLRVQVGSTEDEIDSALRQAGVDPVVPCSGDGQATQGQVFLLLDRALSVPFYARLQKQ